MGLTVAIEAFKWAKEQELKGVHKSVLIYLADRWNRARGYAWPSVARIARETGWHPRTVTNAIRQLKDMGLIEVRRQVFARDASLGPNRYYLPAMGYPIPPAEKTFVIQGEFDFDGTWDPELTYDDFPNEFDSPPY